MLTALQAGTGARAFLADHSPYVMTFREDVKQSKSAAKRPSTGAVARGAALANIPGNGSFAAGPRKRQLTQLVSHEDLMFDDVDDAEASPALRKKRKSTAGDGGMVELCLADLRNELDEVRNAILGTSGSSSQMNPVPSNEHRAGHP